MAKLLASLLVACSLVVGVAQAAPVTASVSDSCDRTPDFTELQSSDISPSAYIRHTLSLRYFDHNNQEIFFEFFMQGERSAAKRYHTNIIDFPVSENGGVVAKTVCTGLAWAAKFVKVSDVETSITMHVEVAELPPDVKNDKLRPEAPIPTIIQVDKVLSAKRGERIEIPVARSRYIDHIEILYHGSSQP
jgi:hypothetical protein